MSHEPIGRASILQAIGALPCLCETVKYSMARSFEALPVSLNIMQSGKQICLKFMPMNTTRGGIYFARVFDICMTYVPNGRTADHQAIEALPCLIGTEGYSKC